MRISGECEYVELGDQWGDWEHCTAHDQTYPCTGDRRERYVSGGLRSVRAALTAVIATT